MNRKEDFVSQESSELDKWLFPPRRSQRIRNPVDTFKPNQEGQGLARTKLSKNTYEALFIEEEEEEEHGNEEEHGRKLEETELDCENGEIGEESNQDNVDEDDSQLTQSAEPFVLRYRVVGNN